uniref:Methyltransferase domain-containing protein n=1 Tax=Pyricularia oryzae (strain P131) TaxID=1143193 RepID=L7ISJ6_PYRO1
MSLVPSITQGQTNAVEPVKSHNHGPRRNTPVPLPFTVGSQPPVGPSHHVPVNQPLKTTTSHPVFKPSSNATQRPRGYAHDIKTQPVAAKRVASDSNSGLNLSLHQMDQSHLTPSYSVDSKLRAESGSRRKHCLENHTAQPPLAELPQNPERTGPAAEAAFKVGQFTEHVTHAEPSGLTGDSKGNSSPGYQPSWDKDPTLPTPSKVLQCLLPAVAENHTSAAPAVDFDTERSTSERADTGNGPLHRVLDLGTGTGIWATEFATKNPATVVYGMDIFAPSPPEIPPNCKFIAGDVTADWKRLAGLHSGQGCGSSEHFDFIHSRMLLLVCPNQDLII